MEIREIIKLFEDGYDVSLTDEAKKRLLILGKQYGLEELEKAVCIAGEQYGDAVDAFYKIEGIIYNRKKRRNFIIKEKQRDE